MKKAYLLSVGLLTLCAASAYAEDSSFLRDELEQIKSDIVVMQRQLYRDKNDTTAPQESVSNVQVRLGEYDQMIRDMNGKVENIEYRLNTLEKKMDTISTDIDLRFEQLQKKIGTPSAGKTKTNNAIKPTAKAPKGTKPQDLYEAALTDLKNNKLNEAEGKLSQFLGSFPKDNLAGNAQYWLGEVYYKQQNFAKAAVAFKDGYSKYPNGTKGADCLLKLGLSMKALGKKEEACTAFVNLPTMFAKITPEIATRAKTEAGALGCK